MTAPRDAHDPDDFDPDDFDPDDFDPERLEVCGYWRCGDLFERRTGNQIFCRKACRSRQRKWERAQARRERKAEAVERRRARR